MTSFILTSARLARGGDRTAYIRHQRRRGLPSIGERLERAAREGDRDALQELARTRPRRLLFKVGGHPLGDIRHARSDRITVYASQIDRSGPPSRDYAEHLATYDGERVLRAWARWCAWQVRAGWEMPPETETWLREGAESVRHAAWYATRSAAWRGRGSLSSASSIECCARHWPGERNGSGVTMTSDEMAAQVEEFRTRAREVVYETARRLKMPREFAEACSRAIGKIPLPGEATSSQEKGPP